MKAKSIDNLIGVSKERLARMIELLTPKHRKFIEEKFDANYNRIEGITWTAADIQLFYVSIRKRLNKLANRDLNSGVATRKHFLQLIGVSKEEFAENKHRLCQEVQDFLNTHFDEDLLMSSNYDLWSDEEKHFYNHMFKSHIRLVLLDSDNSHYQSLPRRFNISLETFSQIYENLSEKSQSIIKSHFDEKFRPLMAPIWTVKDKKYFYNYTYKRIRKLIQNNHKFKYQKTYSDLLEKFNVEQHILEYIVRNIKSEYQNFIYYLFDEAFCINPDIVLSEEELFVLRSKIIPLLKRHITAFKEKQKAMNSEEYREILNETFDPLKNITMLNTSKEDLDLETIYRLKSYYLAQFNYLDKIKKHQVSLTRKKDN